MNPASPLLASPRRAAATPLQIVAGIGAAAAFALSSTAWAVFTSGSTGSDGALTPTVNTEVVLPPSGVLNYTTINIPTGVTITFKKNATNTPVTLLVQADATIAGTIDISGKKSADTGSGGSGNIGDDGLPGLGGSGGFDGGRGGQTGTNRSAGAGLGPGGGGGGNDFTVSNQRYVTGGGGAGFATAPPTAPWYTSNPQNTGIQGIAYGAAQSLPLIGGSGGGGGAGGTSFAGAGGGGGGGALLIAASGTINVTGTINGNGGASGAVAGDAEAAAGGSGSGGTIRLVATTISGGGTLTATGQTYTIPAGAGSPRYYQVGGESSVGRIRLEAETYNRTAASTPVHSFAAPGTVFIAGAPSLRITSVAGMNAPASPTGTNDVQLPATITNPVTIIFAATGAPVGNIIKLTVTPANGAPTSAVSDALTGSTANSTSSTTVTLPQGPSTLQATITYTIVASLGDALRNFAGNERVERIEVATANSGKGESEIKLITTSGKTFIASPDAVKLLSQQG